MMSNDFESTGYRTRKVAIGSVQSGILNFAPDQRYFQSADIPDKASDVKKAVKDDIDPDILGIRKRNWNSSVSIPKTVNDKKEEQDDLNLQLTKVRAGLNDAPIAKYRAKKIPVGVDSRNDYTGWNVSTAQDVGERKRQLEDERQFVQVMHTKKNDTFLRTTGYKGLKQKTKDINESFRQTKMDDQAMKMMLRKEFHYEDPLASEARIEAVVHKRLIEQKRAEKATAYDPDIQETRKKPDMSKTLISVKKKVYHHNGAWTHSNIEGCHAWSCCMNTKKDSQGCVLQIVDPNRWNLASYNN